MDLERIRAAACGRPFPVYERLVDRLLAAHRAGSDERDATLAHVLGTCAAYSYADTATVAMILARLGLEGNACVRIAQTVDAMFVFSTAYLVQSRCGRVVVLCYRGTEPTNLANWLGDADVEPDSMSLDAETVAVHSGFYRNVRATRWAVLGELDRAVGGRSLLDPERTVEHPLEALYVTGHSLGGAMALLLALSVAGRSEHRAVADRLRAIYTFGQPHALLEPLPEIARAVGRKLFRHVLARDVVPGLPPAPWGTFAHFGHEYRWADGEWRRADAPVAQLASLRALPGSLLALFATARRRGTTRFSLAAHVPHEYVAALRPRDRISELGDRD